MVFSAMLGQYTDPVDTLKCLYEDVFADWERPEAASDVM